MWHLRDLNWRRGIFWLTVFAAILAVGLTLFMVSGVYNVAASVRHFAITEVLIRFVLRRSVATHSARIEVPDLSDDGLVRLGAAHFRTGCAPCHGEQGATSSPIVKDMYPAPPSLERAAFDWEAKELFWIVRNGLKFTGMPSWPGERRDDEVWALVAFLERMPELDAGEFAALSGSGNSVGLADNSHLSFGAAADKGTELCAACHGDAARPPVSPLVPALQGQSVGYLRRAMQEYRDGVRESGMMEPIAAALSTDEIQRITARYADMPRQLPARPADPAAVERGREIAERGIADGRIPPCLSCHSDAASARFPRLAGLSQSYISNQLELFRSGVREQTAYGAIMATIARRLLPGQIDAAAAYFAQAPDAAPPTSARKEPAQ